MNSFTVSPFYAGRSAAWRGATLDDVPGYYTDQQADEWERGWYSIMDDERAEAMERERGELA
jgi:hypothetical protein